MRLSRKKLRKLIESALNEKNESTGLDKFQDMAIKLYDAMDGMGTNEEEIGEIFRHMNKEVEALDKVAYLYGAISRGVSLHDDLSDEMSEGDIEEYIDREFPGAMEILSRQQ